MNNPSFERREIVFPMDTTVDDYAEAVELALSKLAHLEKSSVEEVFTRVLEVSEDTISFRIQGERGGEDSLPLPFAGEMLQGAQQAILSAACTVIKPQTEHPRLNRTEAQQLLNKTKFRHTQPGSFILNVSCPVQGVDVQTSFWPEQEPTPFVRRTTQTLLKGVRELISAIEMDDVEAFVAKIKADERPILSSNLCEALVRFEDRSLGNSLGLDILWAGSIPLPKDEQRKSSVRVQRDYFSRIEEVGQALRPLEKEITDTFYGTVERLDGDTGPDGRRAGEVILRLLDTDGESIRTRAILDADQYVQADKAHMTAGKFVKVEGRLHPGRQPRHITDIKAFGLAN
jgi:hypothetical protein